MSRNSLALLIVKFVVGRIKRIALLRSEEEKGQGHLEGKVNKRAEGSSC